MVIVVFNWSMLLYTPDMPKTHFAAFVKFN
jgi:hypothetical protein